MRASLTDGLMRGRRLLVLGSALVAAVAAALIAGRRRRQISAEDGSASLTGVPALALAPGEQELSAPALALSVADAPTPTAVPAAPTARPTRAELYRRAQIAGIKGRSNMTKAQLERALRENGT